MEAATAADLVPVRMKKEDMGSDEVQAFRCGSKPHEQPLAEWLKKHSADRIASGFKIWLYYQKNPDGSKGRLAGYGSLTKGKIETTEADGSKKTLKVMELPELALHQDFWGCPKGTDDPEGKYSRRIVRHLQLEARVDQARGRGVEPILILYVHPDAAAAQRLYQSCGFSFAPKRFLPFHNPCLDETEMLLGMDYCWG